MTMSTIKILNNEREKQIDHNCGHNFTSVKVLGQLQKTRKRKS